MGTEQAQLIQRLKALEKNIQNAEVEVELRERRLKELRPRRQALEGECQEKFGCTVKELDRVLRDKEAELARLVAELEQELEAGRDGTT